MRKWLKVLIFAVLFIAFVYMGSIASDKKQLSNDILRLHVVGASDSKEDQEIKLLVRDAITERLETVMAELPDMETAKAYIQAIVGKIEAYTPDICILDFRDVSFVDSSGIAVVINALRSMAQIEGKLQLTQIPAQPLRVFRASGIDKLVDIREAVS